jgi:hypothetical protein
MQWDQKEEKKIISVSVYTVNIDCIKQSQTYEQFQGHKKDAAIRKSDDN